MEGLKQAKEKLCHQRMAEFFLSSQRTNGRNWSRKFSMKVSKAKC